MSSFHFLHLSDCSEVVVVGLVPQSVRLLYLLAQPLALLYEIGLPLLLLAELLYYVLDILG